MRVPRFYIVQYLGFTAILAVLFALIVGKPSEKGALTLGILFLVGLAPALAPLMPKSLESVLQTLPRDPDDQIAVLEGVLSDRATFRPGPRRSARLRLVRLYIDRKRFDDALSLGRAILAQYRMPRTLEGQLRLEISICLQNVGRDNEAKSELRSAFDFVARTRLDAQGWLVRGRILEASHRYSEAIEAYETALERPLFERKAIHEEAGLRLTQACLKAGRHQRAIDWSERLLKKKGIKFDQM